MDSRSLHGYQRRRKVVPHKILPFLKRKRLLSDERIELLNSFRNTGFSVDTSPTVWPQDSEVLERLGRYMLRCPLSLPRIHWTQGARTLFSQAKASNDDPRLSLFNHPDAETLDVFEFVARVLTQILGTNPFPLRARKSEHPAFELNFTRQRGRAYGSALGEEILTLIIRGDFGERRLHFCYPLADSPSDDNLHVDPVQTDISHPPLRTSPRRRNRTRSILRPACAVLAVLGASIVNRFG